MTFDSRQPSAEQQNYGNAASPNNQRCPGCNSPLVLDRVSRKLRCEYCDNEYDIPSESATDTQTAQTREAQTASSNSSATAQPPASAQGQRNRKGERPLADVANEIPNTDWGAPKKIVTCESCGAQTIYDSVQTISTCPYCDSEQILEEPDKTGSMVPTGICVFKIDRQKAKEQFHDWVKGLWFAPNKLKKVAKAESLDGIYLPYWTYDVQTHAEYKGDYGVEVVEDNPIWRKHDGSVEHFFDDYPIPACKKENGHILDGLGPFDTNDYEEYRPEYMVGYAAERYTIDVHEGWEEAKKRIKKDLTEMAEADIKSHHKLADEARINEISIEYGEVMYKYLMLPIWISSYRYGGKVYQFMVNGQTGKVEGDRPWSAWKIGFAVAAVIIISTIMVLITED